MSWAECGAWAPWAPCYATALSFSVGFPGGYTSSVTALFQVSDQWFQALDGHAWYMCHRFWLPKGLWLCATWTLDGQNLLYQSELTFGLTTTSPTGVKLLSMVQNPLMRWFCQGSVLGPLVFLIYIDDFSCVVQSLLSKVNLFTDDILLYHLMADLQQAICLSFNEINNVITWLYRENNFQ